MMGGRVPHLSTIHFLIEAGLRRSYHRAASPGPQRTYDSSPHRRMLQVPGYVRLCLPIPPQEIPALNLHKGAQTRTTWPPQPTQVSPSLPGTLALMRLGLRPGQGSRSLSRGAITTVPSGFPSPDPHSSALGSWSRNTILSTQVSRVRCFCL